jgi:hypothetical protein
MEQRGAQGPVAIIFRLDRRAARQLQHLERHVPRRGDFAGDDVMRGEADQDGDDAGGILDLAAERPGARVGRSDFGTAYPRPVFRARTVGHLQIELGARSRGSSAPAPADRAAPREPRVSSWA